MRIFEKRNVELMDVQSSQQIIEDLTLESNTPYLAVVFPLDGFNITEARILEYFKDFRGERYWFKSKENTFNKIGINYIDGFTRSSFDSNTLEELKATVFQKLQYIKLDESLTMKADIFGGMRFDDKLTSDEWMDFNMVGFHLARWQFDLEQSAGIFIVEKDELEKQGLVEYILHTLEGIERTSVKVRISNIKSEHEIFPDEWKELVNNTLNVLDDEFLKVVLSRQLLVRMDENIDLNFIINRLLDERGTYIVYFEKNKSVFVSKTPEKLFNVFDNKLMTNAIAGSIPRLQDDTLNDENKAEFLKDEKNLFEHIVVRDSIISDIEPYTKDIVFNDKPSIMENRYIYHLYTPIEAKLNEDANIFDVLYQMHPTPAVGGLPKKHAQEYIKENEFYTRGLYAAPLGFMSEDNYAEFVVSLRSMLIKGSSATLFAGAGIVEGSDPELEYVETMTKFRPMLNVLEAL